MGMPKARLIVRLIPDDSISDGMGVAVFVRDGERGNWGEEYKIGLTALKGSEAMIACKNVGVSGDTRRMNTAEKHAAIIAKVRADGYVPRAFVPKSVKDRETEQTEQTETEQTETEQTETEQTEQTEPKPETEQTETEQTEQTDTAHALAELLSTLAPKIDVSKITADVTTSVLTQIESRLREMDNVPVRVTIVTRERETDLPTHHHHTLPDVVTYLARGHHVFLSGPAGSGKSTIAEQAAEVLGLAFHPVPCDPSMTRNALYGFTDMGRGVYHPTELRLAYEHGGVFCIDEMDNGHPAILAGLNQLLANGGCAFPDGYVKRHPDFKCVATANTWGAGATAEYMGRNPIDAATLNRFVRRMFIDFDPKMERSASLAFATDETHAAVSEWIDTLQGMRRRANENRIKLLITPRDAIAGAKDIACGDPVSKVLANGVFAGVSEEIQAKVMGR